MSSPDPASVRILRRTGFGATGAELDRLSSLSPADLVRHLMSRPSAPDPGTVATPAPRPAFQAPAKGLSIGEKRASRMAAKAQVRALTSWWVRRMVATGRPFDERLTFLWHDHFATAATKVRSAHLLLAQQDTLRRLGRGDFHDLAYAMLTDPAMLVWLDGRRNTAKAPNENLSREFMELFTLGHGDGYTETDVREGARALTGWRVGPDGRAVFHEATHDTGSKTVLGVTGNLDAAGFCDAVLARPASAVFVATQLWQALASPSAPTPELLSRLTTAYGPGRDISALLTAILTAPEFAAAKGSIVVSPVEWLVGALRALSMRPADDKATRRYLLVLRQLGQLPFYPPSVAGWPSGQAWLSTAAVALRMRVAAELAAGADLSALARLGGSARVDEVVHRLGIPALTKGSAAVLRDNAGSPARLVTVALNTPEYLTH